jgi:hypothetical protein
MARTSYLVVALVVVAATAAACSKSSSPQPVASQKATGAGMSARGTTPPLVGSVTEAAGPDDSFQVVADGTAGAAGAETVARVVVRPGKGFHMNKDFPTKLTLELPAGVSSPKPVLVPADAESFSDDELAFAIKLTAVSAGDYSIPATLKFAVCTDSTCNPKKQSLALSLKVQ